MRVKKEYNPANPYAYAAAGTEVLDWGFISPSGKVVTYTGPDRIDHAQLAARKLHAEVTELLNDEGYTRFIVKRSRGTFGTPGDVWGMFLFGAYDMRPVGVMIKYIKARGEIMDVVQVTAADYSLDTLDQVQGTPGEALAWLRQYQPPGDEEQENPAPRRPGERDRRWPFKLTQSGPNFIAETRDLARFNIVRRGDGSWRWAPANTGQWSERFETVEGALLDLEREAESHTGRLGGTMKFIIYSPTGMILGTVSAPNRRAARDKLRGSVQALKLKTAQDAFLYPYISSSLEVRYVADQGVQVR